MFTYIMTNKALKKLIISAIFVKFKFVFLCKKKIICMFIQKSISINGRCFKNVIAQCICLNFQLKSLANSKIIRQAINNLKAFHYVFLNKFLVILLRFVHFSYFVQNMILPSFKLAKRRQFHYAL